MREIAISKFKATCLAVIDEVNRTKKPVRVTRFGKPMAEVRPVTQEPRKLGGMRDSMEILGDIVGPVGAMEELLRKSGRLP